jgi:hypothetical protein
VGGFSFQKMLFPWYSTDDLFIDLTCMANQELNNYIHAQVQRGMGEEEIRKTLVQNGWGQADIDTAFSIVKPKPAAAAHPAPAQTNVQPSVQPQAVAQQPAINMRQPEPVDIFDIDGSTATTQPNMQSPMQSQSAMQPGMPAKLESQPVTMAGNSKPEFKDGLSMKAKILIFGAIGLVVAGLAAGGVYAYFSFYRSPERVGGLMIQNLADLQSFSYSAEIRPRFSDTTFLSPISGGEDIANLTMKANGVASISNSQQPTGTATTNIIVEAADGTETSYNVEARLIEGIVYLLVQNPEAWPVPGMSVLQDRWVVVDQTTLSEPLSGTPSAPFTAEDKVKMRTALRNSKAFVFGDSIGGETIHDVATTQYTFTLTQAGLKTFVEEIQPILREREFCSEKECAAMLETVRAMKDMTGEMWIGKKDYQLYQMRVLYSAPENNASSLRDMVISVTLWNHNAGVTVDVPSAVVRLEEIIEQVMNDLFGADTDTNTNENQNQNANVLNANTNTPTSINVNTNTAPNPKLDTDDDGLTDLEEVDYGTDADDPDSDSDGYPDGEEVDNGYNPLGEGELK